MNLHLRAAATPASCSTPPARAPATHGGSGARGDRMTGIDAARGIAMVLVCASHVRYHFIDSAPDLYFALTHITRLATPTFLLLSGFIAAYVLRSSGQARLRIFDRGLFVLVAGHLLLNLSDLQHVDAHEWMFNRVTVTDAIALCLMTAALLARVSTALLAVLGALLILLSWPVALMWQPTSGWESSLAAVLFSARAEATELTDAAAVPYLGVFLLGMALSRWLFEALQARDYSRVSRKLALVGMVAMTGVVLLAVTAFVLHSSTVAEAEGALWPLLRDTLDPRLKLPPSPAYLLFYSGGGLLLAAACLTCRPVFLMKPIVQWCATLGRASLMSFVVQDWLLLLVPAIAGFDHLSSTGFWMAYLIGALIVLHWLATKWDNANANRVLTVGIKRVAARRLA